VLGHDCSDTLGAVKQQECRKARTKPAGSLHLSRHAQLPGVIQVDRCVKSVWQLLLQAHLLFSPQA
jgi:hypothetical protein